MRFEPATLPRFFFLRQRYCVSVRELCLHRCCWRKLRTRNPENFCDVINVIFTQRIGVEIFVGLRPKKIISVIKRPFASITCDPISHIFNRNSALKSKKISQKQTFYFFWQSLATLKRVATPLV